MMKTLHERVARVMADSLSVGPYNTYDGILAKLRERWPTEEELRARLDGFASVIVGLPPDYKFPEDAE